MPWRDLMNTKYTLYAYYETITKILFQESDINKIDSITKRYENSAEMIKF